MAAATALGGHLSPCGTPAAPVLRRAALALLLVAALAAMPRAQAAERVLIIEGLGGEPLYARQFDTQARAVAAASRALDGNDAVRMLAGNEATRAHILAQFRRLAAQMERRDELVVYLIGHGSFDGREYKFNVPGPDLSDADLKGALQGLPAERQLVIVTGSASGALLPTLGAAHRVLLTATRNGEESNATRFGAALAAALQSPEADTDKDGRISAQEAFTYARRTVQDEYRREGLLASEHAVLQGDAAGDFALASLVPSAAAHIPGQQLRRRAALNARIKALEARKHSLTPAAYQQQLQDLLLQLARLQQQIDPPAAPQPAAGGAAHAPP
ncbi:MAG TPA: C13 family peptidase [Steroidobacteraceae bacterium]|nr:C13 family peptidase [Steroidobacteraceae bacterium]